MKRAIATLITGLLLAVAAYGGFYFISTARDRQLAQSPASGLEWLKKEYQLSDAEFQRVVELHAAYMPECMERCRRITDLNDKFKLLVSNSRTLTPEIESNLAASAQIRLECQKAMLKHFIDVSQTMPQEQGRRYLVWVEENTCLNQHGMEMK
jgi:hypothetical protein